MTRAPDTGDIVPATDRTLARAGDVRLSHRVATDLGLSTTRVGILCYGGDWQEDALAAIALLDAGLVAEPVADVAMLDRAPTAGGYSIVLTNGQDALSRATAAGATAVFVHDLPGNEHALSRGAFNRGGTLVTPACLTGPADPTFRRALRIAAAHARLPEREGVSRCVLWAEDEEIFRDVIQRVLEVSLGARVLTGADGIEALELLERNLPEIDLVVSDRAMPRMEGAVFLTGAAVCVAERVPLVAEGPEYWEGARLDMSDPIAIQSTVLSPFCIPDVLALCRRMFRLRDAMRYVADDRDLLAGGARYLASREPSRLGPATSG